MYGDVCGFVVTDFADHDHVRILAQNRPQTTGERHVGFAVDRRLADAGQVVFHRVFDGQDVAGRRVEVAERGIQAGGFARAGGPGHQKNSVGPGQDVFKAAQGGCGHAQALQVEAPGLFVEQAHHHALAMGRRQSRDAHIDFMPGQSKADAAVLRHALFSDVEARHDFDPRHQQVRQLTFGPQHFAQLAIDAHAHRQVMLEGFQVHIRGFLAHGFTQQRVDQTNDRRITLLLQQVGGLRHLLGHAHQVEFAVEPLRHLLGRALPGAVAEGQTLAEQCIRQPLQLHVYTRPALHFGQHGQRRVAAYQQARRLGRGVQQHAKTSGKAVGQARRRLAHGRAALGRRRSTVSGSCRLPSNIWCGSLGSSSELVSLDDGWLRFRNAL